MNKVVRGVLWALGLFVGTWVVLLVALGGWMMFSASGNEKAATEFCAGIAVGTPAADLPARIEAAGGTYAPNDSGVHDARFSGWGRSDCRMTVVDGRVTGKSVVTEEYD